MRVHRNGVAKRAAEQRMHRRADDFPGQVPQRDVDAADGGDVRHVGVHQGGHVLEVNLDGQGILADQQRLHRFDAGPRHRSGGPRLAVACQPGICIDADQAVTGDVLDRHGADARNLHTVQVGRRQRPVPAEQAGRRQRHGQAQQLTAG